MRKNTKKNKGFTLIEILIVIGIIAILAGIVLIAVNPARQFAQANNANRSSDASAILNAIGQYIVDNKGDISKLDITTTAQDISDSGADICDALVPTYIPSFPTDPLSATLGAGIKETDCGVGDTYNSGYQVVKDVENRITVTAQNTQDVDENGTTPVISITR